MIKIICTKPCRMTTMTVVTNFEKDEMYFLEDRAIYTQEKVFIGYINENVIEGYFRLMSDYRDERINEILE